jgi:hypothetical protein
MSQKIRHWYYGPRITYDNTHDQNVDTNSIAIVQGPAIVWFSNIHGEFIEAKNVYMIPDGVSETFQKPPSSVSTRIGTYSNYVGSQPQRSFSIVWNTLQFSPRIVHDTIEVFVRDCRIMTYQYDDGVNDEIVSTLLARAHALCGTNNDTWNKLFQELIKINETEPIYDGKRRILVDKIDENIIVAIIGEMKQYFQKLNRDDFEHLYSRRKAAEALYYNVYMLPCDPDAFGNQFIYTADEFVYDLFSMKLPDLAMHFFNYLCTDVYLGHMSVLLHSLVKIYKLGYREQAKEIGNYISERYAESLKGINGIGYQLYAELCDIGFNELANKLYIEQKWNKRKKLNQRVIR